MLNEGTIELGWLGHEDEMLVRLKIPDAANYAGTTFSVAAPYYPTLFANAFPEDAVALDELDAETSMTEPQISQVSQNISSSIH